MCSCMFFFFQAEDGIRDRDVTGVQTCALPILTGVVHAVAAGCCAWDELARAVLAARGIEAPVEGITSSELAAPAGRPANGCMESTRAPALRPWRDALQEWASQRAAIGPQNP